MEAYDFFPLEITCHLNKNKAVFCWKKMPDGYREALENMAASAEATIERLWNADNAAGELLRFCKEYSEGKKPKPSIAGPLSIADVIKPPGIIRTFKEKNVLE